MIRAEIKTAHRNFVSMEPTLKEMQAYWIDMNSSIQKLILK